MRLPFFTRPSRAPGGCPSCGNAVDADQLACIECGALLERERRLAAAAWRAPVVLVASVLLLLATGFGFASGAVAEDGEVTVAQAPPPAPAPTATSPPEATNPPEVSGGESTLPELPKPGEAGGGDELALDPGDLDGGSGSGSGSRDDESEGGSGGSGLSDGGRSSGGRDRTERSTRSKSSSPRSTSPEAEAQRVSWQGSGYAVVLKTSRSRDEAEREAREARRDGLPAGVVASNEFGNQPSGRFIAFAGQRFSSREEADRYLGNTVDPEGYSATVLFLDRAGSGRTP